MAEEWNKEKIEQLISNEVQESLTLEYKSAGALEKTDKNKTEITKDVSAMANSVGGTIIYGIAEYQDQDKKHLPEKIDAINQSEIKKEWLEQVINTITPRINNIIITPVNVNADNGNSIVYVLEIPQSDTAHQAQDFRYYKRFNFMSTQMYDYEIRDVMSRNKNPKMELSFYFYIDKYSNVGTTIYTLNIDVKNVGSVYAKYVNGIFHIPLYLIDYDDIEDKDIILENGINYYIDYEYNTKREIVAYNGNRPEFSPVRYDPILPSLTRTWLIPIKNLSEIKPSGSFKSYEKLKWTIHADNAPVISGEVYLDQIDLIIAKEPPNA